jgi:hypothetical protein
MSELSSSGSAMMAVREHVRQMLVKLKRTPSEREASLDYTVQVDREKNRTGRVDRV